MSNEPLDQETIAALARKFWEEEGRPEGKDQEHWLRAETQLRAQERKQTPAPPEPGAALLAKQSKKIVSGKRGRS